MQNTSVRRPYLDWLRIIVVLMLIPFHTAMTFAPFPWYLSNNKLNLATQALVTVLDVYHMPLLFLITGAAIYFSLGVRNWRDYSIERVLRLVVPLIFGMLVIVPPCYWVAAKSYWPYYQGSLWQYYPQFWKQNLLPFQSQPGHALDAGALWFLWYLVFYTIALSPFFLLIRKKVSDGFFIKLSKPFENPVMIFALFIPVALVEIYANNRIVGWTITANFHFFYYIIFFIYGFFIFSAPGFEKGLNRAGIWAIAIGAITIAFYMLILFPTWQRAAFGPQFWTHFHGDPGTAGYYIYRIALRLSTWSWIVGFIYLARKFLNFSNRFVQYGNDAVLPYYIIHSTPIALIGLWIVKQPWEVLPKYALNVVLAFLAIAIVYELIRRTNVTRFLFGMRLKKRPVAKPGVIADGQARQEGLRT